MVNRITRILALAALCAAPGGRAFAQAYAIDGPVPAYPPEVYRAQDADGGYGVARAGVSQAHARLADRDDGRPDHARYDRDGYDQDSRRGQRQGRALEDRRAQRQTSSYESDFRRESGRRVERVETSYRFLSWSGKVEERDGYAYESSDRYSDRHAGPRCPSVRTGERVLDCRYIPFAEPEPQGQVLSSLYIDGGVGPNVISGGGGGGGGPSNGQVFLGAGFSGVSIPTFNGGGGGNGGGSGNGSGSGSGTGVGSGSGSGSGVANSSSSSVSSASASVSASLSSSITVGGGFFIHGGGGHWGGGGGKPGGCGCGGGGMSGWGGGGHKK